MKHCLSSMVPGLFVNEFQRSEFARFGKAQRDPMFITGATLMELEAFPTVASLVDYCQTVTLEEMRRQGQWLFTGMTQEDMDLAFSQRTAGGLNPSFKSAAELGRLRAARAAAPAGPGEPL